MSILFVLILAANFFYSLLRVKKYFLVKNLYTGLGISLAFLYGALTVSKINGEIIAYYLLMSLLIFIGSVISDLRDYEGDRKTGVNTIPAVLGFGRAKKFVYVLLLLFSVMILIFEKFIILLPFAVITFLFLQKDVISSAHLIGGLSLIFLAMWLFF